jgi:peptide/nickel transport system substrate-binding protein
MESVMKLDLTRRRLLKNGAALGASAFVMGLPRLALAQHESIVVRIERDIQNMDPANRIGAVEGNILRAVMRRLIMFKPGSFDWENDAAEAINQVDETTIEFTLKSGIMWQQDYGELTAEDVKFSFERFNPAEGEEASYAADWAALDHVEVTGTHSGRLILKHPAPALWAIGLSDVSGCIVCRKAYEELGEEVKTTKIIGAGPYMVAEWRPNESLTLRADPAYLGPAPAIPEIVLRPIQEPRTAQLAFRSDEVHFTKLDDPAAAEALADDPSARIIKLDSINYVWIGMNVEKPPLDDVRVRQAIRLGVDVEEVILAAYNGTVSRADALMAPGLLGHWAEAPMHIRDVEEAKRLLAEAGHEGGLEIRLTLLNESHYVTAAQVVQAQLAEIGITVNLEVLDGGSYWSMGEGEAGENLELSLQEFGGKADPSFQTQWFVSGQVGEWNWQRWRSEEFDRLNTEAESTVDEAKRGELYMRMQQLMEESAAYIWLTHGVNVFATKEWLEPSILPNGDDWQYRHFKATA